MQTPSGSWSLETLWGPVSAQVRWIPGMGPCTHENCDLIEDRVWRTRATRDDVLEGREDTVLDLAGVLLHVGGIAGSCRYLSKILVDSMQVLHGIIRNPSFCDGSIMTLNIILVFMYGEEGETSPSFLRLTVIASFPLSSPKGTLTLLAHLGYCETQCNGHRAPGDLDSSLTVMARDWGVGEGDKNRDLPLSTGMLSTVHICKQHSAYSYHCRALEYSRGMQTSWKGSLPAMAWTCLEYLIDPYYFLPNGLGKLGILS